MHIYTVTKTGDDAPYLVQPDLDEILGILADEHSPVMVRVTAEDMGDDSDHVGALRIEVLDAAGAVTHVIQGHDMVMPE